MKNDLSFDELKKQLLINKNNLHEECFVFPEYFRMVAEKTAEAVSRRDFLKEEKEKLYAELFINIKKSGEKVTDSTADSLTKSHPDYTQIVEDFLDAKKEVELWGALKESYYQKSQMLKILSDLFCTGYFTEMSLLRNKE
ncbi:MAG TPA: hypothetical protein PLH46_00860 [Caldisericia bacterium]|nr:hypothetical protein [Caldisericia bacterium]